MNKGQSQINLSNRTHFQLSDHRNIIWSLGAYGDEEWVLQHFDVVRNDIIEKRYRSIKEFEDKSIYDIITLLGLFRMVPAYLCIWSNLSGSHGKIMYYPFNNIDLINYIFSIPWKIKLKSPKHVLRAVAQELNIPKFIIARPKASFGIISNRWHKKGGVFDPLIPLASKVFDEKEIRNMQSNDPKKGMAFWNILNYSIWKRLYINNEPVRVLVEELNDAI